MHEINIITLTSMVVGYAHCHIFWGDKHVATYGYEGLHPSMINFFRTFLHVSAGLQMHNCFAFLLPTFQGRMTSSKDQTFKNTFSLSFLNLSFNSLQVLIIRKSSTYKDTTSISLATFLIYKVNLLKIFLAKVHRVCISFVVPRPWNLF